MTRPGSSAPTSPGNRRSRARIRRTTYAGPDLLRALREDPDRRDPRRHRDIRPSGEDAVRRPQADIRGLGELRVDLLS
ncbi:hypothetical protein [Streptomyces collinus]|uniref:hypothetical protein n=1 Tax=Streptomyces collinus TaxID=42684 RepID=UPI00363DCF20